MTDRIYRQGIELKMIKLHKSKGDYEECSPEKIIEQEDQIFNTKTLGEAPTNEKTGESLSKKDKLMALLRNKGFLPQAQAISNYINFLLFLLISIFSPFLITISIFWLFYIISMKSSCFMSEFGCYCAANDILIRLLYSLRELFVQGMYFIFPYYLIFRVKDIGWIILRKIIYYLSIPALIALLFLADGNKDYPSLTKNVILIGNAGLLFTLKLISHFFFSVVKYTSSYQDKKLLKLA